MGEFEFMEIETPQDARQWEWWNRGILRRGAREDHEIRNDGSRMGRVFDGAKFLDVLRLIFGVNLELEGKASEVKEKDALVCIVFCRVSGTKTPIDPLYCGLNRR